MKCRICLFKHRKCFMKKGEKEREYSNNKYKENKYKLIFKLISSLIYVKENYLLTKSLIHYISLKKCTFVKYSELFSRL